MKAEADELFGWLELAVKRAKSLDCQIKTLPDLKWWVDDYCSELRKRDRSSPFLKVLIDNEPKPQYGRRLLVDGDFFITRTYCLSAKVATSKVPSYGVHVYNHTFSSRPATVNLTSDLSDEPAKDLDKPYTARDITVMVAKTGIQHQNLCKHTKPQPSHPDKMHSRASCQTVQTSNTNACQTTQTSRRKLTRRLTDYNGGDSGANTSNTFWPRKSKALCKQVKAPARDPVPQVLRQMPSTKSKKAILLCCLLPQASHMAFIASGRELDNQPHSKQSATQ